MGKKNKSKKSTPSEQENTTLSNPVDNVKGDSQQNDSEVCNEIASASSTQETRRQKKNRKQQEKKKSDGSQQKATVENPSLKTEIVQNNDEVLTEPKSSIGIRDNASSWQSVEHSSRKVKNVNMHKDTEVADQVHPYKQHKKEAKVPATKGDKSEFDYFNNEPKYSKSNDKKPRDFGKPRLEDNLEVTNEIHPYKQHKKDTKVPSTKNDKGHFDYYNNEPVNSFKGDDKKLEKKSRREDNDYAWDNRIEGGKSSTKEQTDKDFDHFNIIYKEKKFTKDSYVKVKEIDEDLFKMPETYALAHCVAEDMAMGSGIAVQFSQKFKRRDELYNQNQRQGGMAVLEGNGRFIYYLVTKKVSNGKPTLYTMWNSLQKMKQHIRDHKVNKLALPRIGCGLDRLEWSEVKAMIEYTFRDVDVDITVCNFQQAEEDGLKGSISKQFKCPVINVRYPLVDIESGTAIIYFGTVNGHVSEDMESLDNKFGIIGEYKRANRKLGDVIQVYKNQQEYSLLGCITRTTEKDPFDFGSFQKCIMQIKKLNKSYYLYVAFQAFLDNHDDLLLTKITNMLRYSLIKVDVYVCWGGKMSSFMPQERGGGFI